MTPTEADKAAAEVIRKEQRHFHYASSIIHEEPEPLSMLTISTIISQHMQPERADHAALREEVERLKAELERLKR